MPRPPAHLPMTDEEIESYNSELAVNSRLYNKDASAMEKAGIIVETIGASLAETPKKISLSDVDMVKVITKKYIDSCSRTGLIPSITGLARSLGYNRRSLYKYISEHPRDESSQFLQMAADAFAEMLSNSSLQGGNHPIVGIFLLKCLYGYRDNQPIEQEITDSHEPPATAEEIRKKYEYLLSEEFT